MLFSRKNKSCLNYIKFWEVSWNPKRSRFWKLQLSMSCGTQKYAKIPLPMGCGQDDLVLLLFLPFWRALAYKYPGGLIQCVRYKNIIDGPNSIYLISPICQCYPFVVFLVKTIVDVRCKKTSLLQVCVYASGDLSGDLIKSELFFGSNFWRVFAIWNHCVAWRESHYQVWISYHNSDFIRSPLKSPEAYTQTWSSYNGHLLSF